METKDMPFYLDNAERARAPGPHQDDETTANVELQPTMHPVKPAPEPDDAGAPRELLHPVEDPPPWPYAKTREEKIEAIREFAARLAEVVEEEYGDWQRRAATYWWHLEEALRDEPPEIRRMMAELLDFIQFNPDFRIIETRRRAVEMCIAMMRKMGVKGHCDVHDFSIALSRKTEEEPVPPYSIRFKYPEKPEIEPYLQGGDLSINGELSGM